MADDETRLTDLEPRFYPNKIGRLMLLSLEDVAGRNSVSALLNQAGVKHLVNNYPPNDLKREFPFHEVSAIMETMTTMYGARGSRGMALRAGRYSFNLGLKDFGPLLGLSDLALRVMPMTMKMKITLTAVAQAFDRFTDQPTKVEERPGQFIYIIEECPVCWGRHVDKPCCFIAQGILEEAVTWATGGRRFSIAEVECRGVGGHACIFAIDKEPID